MCNHECNQGRTCDCSGKCKDYEIDTMMQIFTYIAIGALIALPLFYCL